jgi:hypothetical protein
MVPLHLEKVAEHLLRIGHDSNNQAIIALEMNGHSADVIQNICGT